MYVSWLTGGLTRHILSDIADASLVAEFLDNAPATFLDGCRTSLPGSCELTKWFPGCVLPCRDVVIPEQGFDFIGAGLPGLCVLLFNLVPVQPRALLVLVCARFLGWVHLEVEMRSLTEI